MGIQSLQEEKGSIAYLYFMLFMKEAYERGYLDLILPEDRLMDVAITTAHEALKIPKQVLDDVFQVKRWGLKRKST